MSLVTRLFPASARRGDDPVAFGGLDVRWDTLERQVAGLAARLPAPTAGSEIAFAFGRDRLACAAALLATWTRGHAAVVPEDATRDRVAPLLQRPGHVLLLHDTGVGRGLFVPALLDAAADPPPSPEQPLARERPVLVTVRRQSFGVVLEERWTVDELWAHLERLDARLERPKGAAIGSTLTPTALPGMFLGLLLPLLRGGRFGAMTPAEISAGAGQARAAGAEFLVTTAAHARALAGLPPASQGPPETRLIVVDEEPGPRHAALLAQRQRAHVVVQPDLPLAGEPDPWQRGLLEQEGVEDAALLTVPPSADEGGVELIGVVAAADARTGVAQLVARRGARAGQSLRFLDSLPRDVNGHLAAADYLLLFGRGRAGRPLVRTLDWVEVPSGDPAVRRFRTALPRDYVCFEGHFPAYPVLAGVAQLHELVLPCVRQILPDLGPLERLKRVKFLARIAPEEEVEVVLRGGARPGAIDFAVERGGAVCSLGSLQLRVREGDAR